MMLLLSPLLSAAFVANAGLCFWFPFSARTRVATSSARSRETGRVHPETRGHVHGHVAMAHPPPHTGLTADAALAPATRADDHLGRIAGVQDLPGRTTLPAHDRAGFGRAVGAGLSATHSRCYRRRLAARWLAQSSILCRGWFLTVPNREKCAHACAHRWLGIRNPCAQYVRTTRIGAF